MEGKKTSHARRCTAPRLGNLFLLYLNGNVSSDVRQRIETHLKSCQACRAELTFFAAGLRGRIRKKAHI